MAEVILEGVDKSFGKNTVVKNVNLNIQDGEFMVLVGPSGCGKSTTLRMIAGLEDISAGKIYVGDRCVNNVAPRDRDIAMVFQNYALYPHMTVYENMAFGLKLRRYSKSEIHERVIEASEILGLQEFLYRRPKELSGGQRQRVAVGRAIVRKPKVFLFDEPLSNLDAKLRVQMRIEISKLHQRLETTMIYVTHDQTEAMTMGDRITVMHMGEIQQVDKPLVLYNEPVNHFVAGFIGSPAMNFFEGKLIKADYLHFESDFLNISLPGTWQVDKSIAPDMEVILGIRPENISLEPFTDLKNKGYMESTVEVLEPMGNELFTYLNCNSKLFLMRSEPSLAPQINQMVKTYIDVRKIHLFSKKNGKAFTKKISNVSL